MELVKPIVVTAIAGICLVVSVVIGVRGVLEFKRDGGGGITVTGSATQDFTSDLIVWRGSFSRNAQTTKEAYDLLKNDALNVERYLTDNGVPRTEFAFSSVSIVQNMRPIFNDQGYIQEHVPDGYTLTQNIAIESNDVDKIESISRDITKLIDSGIEFFSSSPEYYYTGMDELKLAMISEATENARSRAEIIAEQSKSSLSGLVSASLGVFQITAQNSSSEEYSYGGVFNTWSKNKTASITVKLHYDIK